jgi:hypothetical protein
MGASMITSSVSEVFGGYKLNLHSLMANLRLSCYRRGTGSGDRTSWPGRRACSSSGSSSPSSSSSATPEAGTQRAATRTTRAPPVRSASSRNHSMRNQGSGGGQSFGVQIHQCALSFVKGTAPMQLGGGTTGSCLQMWQVPAVDSFAGFLTQRTR